MRSHHASPEGHWVQVDQRMPGFDEIIRPAVWNMLVSTYAKLGMIVDQPSELDVYNVWDVYADADGHLIAFRLNRATPFGIKGGLVGSDGSRAGRAAVKQYVAEWYLEPGNYAEVSHRMQELAFDAGAPVVCATYAAEVLSKPVTPEPDGVFYRRVLKNVGEVTKVIVGRPRDVPLTSSAAPQCPLPSRAVAGHAQHRVDTSVEAEFSHMASLVDL